METTKLTTTFTNGEGKKRYVVLAENNEKQRTGIGATEKEARTKALKNLNPLYYGQ